MITKNGCSLPFCLLNSTALPQNDTSFSTASSFPFVASSSSCESESSKPMSQMLRALSLEEKLATFEDSGQEIGCGGG